MTDDLRVAVAELRIELREARHDVKNLTMGLENVVTQREFGEAKERISKLEAIWSKILWGIALSWLGIIATAFGAKLPH